MLSPRRGLDALLSAVEQLQGCPIPASVLESEILPARVAGYQPADLDQLCAAGEVVWRGLEPLGPRDGRIALYLPDRYDLLAPSRGAGRGRARASRSATLLGRRAARSSSRTSRARRARFAGDLSADALGPGLGGRGHQRHARAAPVVHRRGRPTRAARRPRRARSGRRRSGPARERGALVASARSGRDGRLRRPSAAPRSPARSSSATASSRARRCTRRGSPAASRRSTTSSRRWRKRAACGAATSSRASARRSSRCPAPTTGCVRVREPSPEARTWVLAATDPANPWGAALPWPESAVAGAAAARRGRARRPPRRRAPRRDRARRPKPRRRFCPPEEPERDGSGARARGGARGAGRRGPPARGADLADRRRRPRVVAAGSLSGQGGLHTGQPGVAEAGRPDGAGRTAAASLAAGSLSDA